MLARNVWKTFIGFSYERTGSLRLAVWDQKVRNSRTACRNEEAILYCADV